jgi:outer membrane receptor protein involved in Fe transport
MCAGIPVAAQPVQRRDYHLETQDLGVALRAVGRAANREIIFETDVVQGKRAPALEGSYTTKEAVDVLLRGTDLVAVERRGAILIRERFRETSAELSSNEDSADIVVTGSHIRGAPSTSPVTSISRVEAQRSGQTDLGQVIRDLPQNFSGGQNPTIAGGGQGPFTNVSGSSTLNLRGLGPDASLTLLNGHRVAFDAISQGIDISAIPLAAIERVDVVTDGASALYGSDAVAGVANVVLRRNVKGIITSARLGAATDGGAVTQQYSIVAGPSWDTGGFMAAADYQHATEITARQRSYTGNLPPDATLIPGQKQISLIMAGRQQVRESVILDVDAHYMHRSTSRCYSQAASTSLTSCYLQGSAVSSTVDNWSISPSLSVNISSQWDVRISGTYSESDTSITNRTYANGVETSLALLNYVNDLKAIEVGAEGSLFSLPGGEARLALGGGYRSSTLEVDSRRFAGGSQFPIDLFHESRKVAFAYGELSLPVISSENALAIVHKLHFVGALRYEDHRNIDRVTTPKLGVVYAPIGGVEIKASWGKSFKVPTLYQTGQTSNAQLLPGAIFNPRPATSDPVLYIFGGNRNLGPERATTWTVSSTFTPAFFDGFRAEIAYFRIRYRDRVTSPFSPITSALRPIYSDFVRLNPTVADVLSAIDGINGAFSNFSGQPFNSGAVSAILDDRLQNISLQSLEGVDVFVRYDRDLSDLGMLAIKGAASYLDSTRRITASLPAMDSAGLVFTPPHWRGRLSAGWERGNVTVTAVGSYIGGTEDSRFAPVVRVGSFATLDTVATIRSDVRQGVFANIELTIAIQNLFNEKPAFVRSTDPSALRYDSTNNSTFGRVTSLTLTKKW